MLRAAIKFCGGCNPRYDRGAAYRRLCEATADCVLFSLPEPDVHYDALVILRGCAACPYLYEEIDAAHRYVVVEEHEIAVVICRLCAAAHAEPPSV